MLLKFSARREAEFASSKLVKFFRTAIGALLHHMKELWLACRCCQNDQQSRS